MCRVYTSDQVAKLVPVEEVISGLRYALHDVACLGLILFQRTKRRTLAKPTGHVQLHTPEFSAGYLRRVMLLGIPL